MRNHFVRKYPGSKYLQNKIFFGFYREQLAFPAQNWNVNPALGNHYLANPIASGVYARLIHAKRSWTPRPTCPCRKRAARRVNEQCRPLNELDVHASAKALVDARVAWAVYCYCVSADASMVCD